MNNYFEFLCSLCGVSLGKDRYIRLLTILHQFEFYHLVPNDDNREADGLQFRSLYLDNGGLSEALSLPNSIQEGHCTVFEMLLGVANRLEFELLGGRYERPAKDWFWVLIDNLELSEYNDEMIKSHPWAINKIESCILTLLSRKYFEDGTGGLFPLKYPPKDQRRVEIWYQMSAWVIENYPI